MKRRFVLRRLFVRSDDEFWSARIAMFAFLALSFGLIFQADRFSRTPAYGNLILLASAPTWGFVYLTAASSLFLWLTIVPRSVKWGVAAHAIPLALTGFWLFAFVYRYFTDSSTTIVNVVNWSVALALLAHSEFAVFRHRVSKPADSQAPAP